MSDSVEIAVSKALAQSLGSAGTQFSELVADKIRFLRWKSAVKTLDKAKAFSLEYGGLEKTPPLKFFLPFMESCSLEEDDEEIYDLWANLLLDATIDFGPGHLLFIRILKEITSSEAKLLHDIVHSNGMKPVSNSALDDAIASWEMFSAPASPLSKINIKGNFSETVNFVFDNLQMPGIAIEHLSLDKNQNGIIHEEESIFVSDTVFNKHNYISRDILESLNLIKKVEQTYKGRVIDIDGKAYDNSKYQLYSVAYCMTAMGAAFYSACADREAVDRRKE